MHTQDAPRWSDRFGRPFSTRSDTGLYSVILKRMRQTGCTSLGEDISGWRVPLLPMDQTIQNYKKFLYGQPPFPLFHRSPKHLSGSEYGPPNHRSAQHPLSPPSDLPHHLPVTPRLPNIEPNIDDGKPTVCDLFVPALFMVGIRTVF